MENTKEFRTWLDAMTLSHPLVIAGPCSAETEEQVMEIAQQLTKTDATVFRAGIWKPRTRPGNFEGIGEEAFSWLKRVKKETGLLISVEIANAAHAKLALENDVDILWIGARTAVNPFAVQEIAEAVEGTDKIVLIKNPINPDLDLWIGAVERFYKMGVTNLGVIHRGFSTYRKTKFRNNPQWQIPIELKNRFPDLPIICDPSHICGNRETIFEVSQTALDLQFDGLMIETHHTPDKAWSDAKQQITPERLNQITIDLRIRQEKVEKEVSKEKLKVLRSQINEIDQSIIEIMAERMSVVKKIGEVKKNENVAILQNDRWTEIIYKMMEEGESNGLSRSFVEKIFVAIHEESIQHQSKLLKG